MDSCKERFLVRIICLLLSLVGPSKIFNMSNSVGRLLNTSFVCRSLRQFRWFQFVGQWLAGYHSTMEWPNSFVGHLLNSLMPIYYTCRPWPDSLHFPSRRSRSSVCGTVLYVKLLSHNALLGSRWVRQRNAIRDFPYYATFREKRAKLACADKLGVFLSLTLCKKASFEYLAFIK